MKPEKLNPKLQPLGEIFDYARSKTLLHVTNLKDAAKLQHWLDMARDAIKALEHGYTVWEDGEEAKEAACFYSLLYKTCKLRIIAAGADYRGSDDVQDA